MQSLLAHYKQVCDRMQLTTPLTDPLKISILAGLYIADELYKARNSHPSAPSLFPDNSLERDIAEQITAKLIDDLDKAVL